MAVVIEEPVARGCVDVASSSVTGSLPSPTVSLMPRPSAEYSPNSDNSGATFSNNRTQVLYARVSGVDGATPTFICELNPAADLNAARFANNELVWRYQGDHRWTRFDHVSGGADQAKQGWNDTPFSADVVEIGLNLPYGPQERDVLFADCVAAGYVFRLPSDIFSPDTPAYSYGQITGANYSDLDGSTLPDLDLVCYGLRDDSADPPSGKRKALIKLFSGVHAGEDMGTWASEAFVREWLSDVELRRRFNIHYYPIVNISGRYAGYSRGTAETAHAGWDCNRQMPDKTANIYEVVALRTALIEDGYGDISLDCHTDGFGPDPESFVWRGSVFSAVDSAWLTAANNLASTNIENLGDLGSDSLTLHLENNGCPGFTLEFGMNSADQHAVADDVGAAFAQALRTIIDNGDLVVNAVTGVGPLAHTRMCALSTVPAQITGSHQGRAIEFTEACLPSEMFDADGPSPAQADGGDIRFFLDADGLVPLPCHIKQFSTNADPALGKAVIRVRLPEIRDTQADTIYVRWNTPTSDTQPPPDDPAGRYAVYAWTVSSWGFDESAGPALDASRNGNDGTLQGAAARTAGVSGEAVEFGGAGDYVEIAADDTLDLLSAFTYAAWVNPATTAARQSLFSKYDLTNGAAGYAVDINTTSPGDVTVILSRLPSSNFDVTVSTGGVLSQDTWRRVVVTWDKAVDGGAMRIFADGAEVSYAQQPLKTTDIRTSNVSLKIGRTYTTDRDFAGLQDEVYLEARPWSADWVATEYANQSDPAGFISVGTPEDVGGGGAIVNLGLVTETDTALALQLGKVIALGLATEADGTFVFHRAKATGLGFASETGTALPLGFGKIIAIGVAAEADGAFALGKAKIKAFDLVTEGDTALPLGFGKIIAMGQVSEADGAFSFARAKAMGVGIASETNMAWPYGRLKARSFGIAMEVDTAAIFTARKAHSIGLASEIDTALLLGLTKIVAMGVAAEADATFSFARAKVKAFGLAGEQDIGLSMGAEKMVAIGQASEADEVMALARAKALGIGPVVETDSGLPITVIRASDFEIQIPPSRIIKVTRPHRAITIHQ